MKKSNCAHSGAPWLELIIPLQVKILVIISRLRKFHWLNIWSQLESECSRYQFFAQNAWFRTTIDGTSCLVPNMMILVWLSQYRKWEDTSSGEMKRDVIYWSIFRECYIECYIETISWPTLWLLAVNKCTLPITMLFNIAQRLWTLMVQPKSHQSAECILHVVNKHVYIAKAVQALIFQPMSTDTRPHSS